MRTQSSASSADDPWLQVLSGQAPASDADSRKALALRESILEPDAGTPTEVLRPDQQRQILALLGAGFRGYAVAHASGHAVVEDPPPPPFDREPAPGPARRGGLKASPRFWIATPWAGSFAAIATLAATSVLLVWHGQAVGPAGNRLSETPSFLVVDADPALHALRMRDRMRQLGVRAELQGEVTLSATVSKDQVEPVRRYLASQGVDWRGGDSLVLVVRTTNAVPADR